MAVSFIGLDFGSGDLRWTIATRERLIMLLSFALADDLGGYPFRRVDPGDESGRVC